MSGGTFDYAYMGFSMFADALRNKLEQQGADPSGSGALVPEWRPEVARTLAEIAALADYAGRLAKEAEWLYSGDTGEETFLRHVAEIERQRREIEGGGKHGTTGQDP